MIFALQFKNHKADTLSVCRKQNSRTFTAAAVNQLLLTTCGPRGDGAFTRPQMANQTAGERDRPGRSLPGWPRLGFRLRHSLRVGLGKIFLTNLIVSLGLFPPCSHVDLKAIRYDVDTEKGLGAKVEDK